MTATLAGKCHLQMSELVMKRRWVLFLSSLDNLFRLLEKVQVKTRAWWYFRSWSRQISQDHRANHNGKGWFLTCNRSQTRICSVQTWTLGFPLQVHHQLDSLQASIWKHNSQILPCSYKQGVGNEHVTARSDVRHRNVKHLRTCGPGPQNWATAEMGRPWVDTHKFGDHRSCRRPILPVQDISIMDGWALLEIISYLRVHFVWYGSSAFGEMLWWGICW